MARSYEAPRSRDVYNPDSEKPFKISRARIELFRQCMRCFYVDRRLGIDRPPGFPFNLNNAVDNMLKNEFDLYRETGFRHYLIDAHNIDARPARHTELDNWRNNFKGVRTLHEPTNLEVFGAIDDLWINSDDRYHVIDYKATARKEPVATEADLSHGEGYRRQLEVYQWLLRQKGMDVSDTAYWVYATGRSDEPRFDETINFDMRIIPYEGDDSWVEPTLHDIKATLDSDELPCADTNCNHCKYVQARVDAEFR